MKFSKVVSVETQKLTGARHMADGSVTLSFKQRHRYQLDCGHTHTDVVYVGTGPKTRIKCKRCQREAAHGK